MYRFSCKGAIFANVDADPVFFLKFIYSNYAVDFIHTAPAIDENLGQIPRKSMNFQHQCMALELGRESLSVAYLPLWKINFRKMNIA